MPTSAHLFLTVNARDQTGVVFPTANNDNEHLFVEQQMPELTLYQAYTLCSPNLYDNSARWWVGREVRGGAREPGSSVQRGRLPAPLPNYVQYKPQIITTAKEEGGGSRVRPDGESRGKGMG